MTRTPLFAFILISILLICSCSKSDNDTPTPTPPVDTTTLVKPDTLTAGWSKIKVSPSPNPLYDVYFNDNIIGYAIGGLGGLYKSIDGGASWTLKNNSTTGGLNMSVTNNGNIHYTNANAYVYTSVNGGSNFSSIDLISPGNGFDIFFPDDNNGFTVCGGTLFQTTDGGVNWAWVSSTTGLSLSANGYYSLFFLNDSTGWIMGEGKSYKSNGNIHNWSQTNLPGTPSTAIIYLHAPSASVVYATNSQTVFKSVDSGRNFSSIYTFHPLVGISSDIHFIDTNTGYVCSGTRIYKTTNGGITWVPVVSLGGPFGVIEIHFTDANHGWGCTDDGYILRYSL